MNYKTVSIVAMSAWLFGCVSVKTSDLYKDGLVSQRVSEFDGAKEIVLEVSHLRDYKIKLGARKTSKMSPGQAILIAEIQGALNIADKESLQLNVDGQIYRLTPADLTTKVHKNTLSSSVVSIYNHSSREYEIEKELLTKIISASKVVVRIVFLDGKYTEDILAPPPNWGTKELKPASEGLKDFYKVAFNAS